MLPLPTCHAAPPAVNRAANIPSFRSLDATSYAWCVIPAGPFRLRSRSEEWQRCGRLLLARDSTDPASWGRGVRARLLHAATLARRAEATAQLLSTWRHREDSKHGRVFSCQDLGVLGCLFATRYLFTEPLSHRVSVESNQRAPIIIEVLTPRDECRRTATVFRDRAVKVRHGLLKHRV